MRPPAFWSDPSHPAARLLGPLGLVYGALAARRMDRPGIVSDRPVICVGNFTLGGAGKTPTALRLVGLLEEFGERPFFLTRGYGGETSGPVRVDPRHHAARDVGDEPLLLARRAPTVVARDRPAGAALCAREGASVIVMDDGLQNPTLRKDLALAVVDAGVGNGNALTFPAGPLRAPLSRQWPHVDGLVLIGDGSAGEAVAREAETRGLPVFRARLATIGGDDLAGRDVLAFAGIGRPHKFFDSLRETGARVVAERSFPDHHAYRAAELAGLVDEAKRRGAMLITTEKDHVRLPLDIAARTTVLRVELRFADDAGLRARLRDAIGCRRCDPGPAGDAFTAP